jgi:hypothetical protein
MRFVCKSVCLQDSWSWCNWLSSLTPIAVALHRPEGLIKQRKLRFISSFIHKKSWSPGLLMRRKQNENKRKNINKNFKKLVPNINILKRFIYNLIENVQSFNCRAIERPVLFWIFNVWLNVFHIQNNFRISQWPS